MRDIHAQRWHQVVPNFSAKGEQRNQVYEIPDWNGVDVEVRCPEPVILNLVTKDGETLFLASGTVAGYRGRLVGAVALEVVCTAPYAIRLDQKKRWFEVVDPEPAVVVVDRPGEKAVEDIVRVELAKYVQKLKDMNAFNEEVEVEELLEDIRAGDLEFEEESMVIDNFGLGYTEMEEEILISEPELPFGEQDAPEPGAPAPADKTAPDQPAAVPTT